MEKLLRKELNTIEFTECITENVEEECEALCVCGAELIPKLQEDFIWHPSNSF